MRTRTLVRIFLRTYFIGAVFNTRGMQNIGLAFIMEPGLQALYAKDTEALRKARLRYMEHYNTHPFWTPLLVGLFLSMEQKTARGLVPLQTMNTLHTTAVYSLSALGDSFFGGSFFVFWALVGINLVALEKPVSLGLWLLFWLLTLQVFKIVSFARAYALGFGVLQSLKSLNLIDWGNRLKLVNALLLALFVAHAVPGSGLMRFPWLAGVVFLALLSARRVHVRLWVVAVVLGLALFFPWNDLTFWGMFS